MKLRLSVILTLLLFSLVKVSFSQNKLIQGVVTNIKGAPQSGIIIINKSSQNTTLTDFDGRFTKNAKPGDTLLFKHLGFKNQTVIPGYQKQLNIIMLEQKELLKEVVITAFKKPKKQRALGYATTTVNSEEITRVNNSTNPFESLSGKIAGIDITAPAQPGASSKIILRGFSSLSQNTPLYVVDGTPISASINGTNQNSANNSVTRSFDGGSNINDLDPNNIANIEVLKGGAAAALYGSRASNGVILITTKKGTQGLKVDFVSAIDFLEIGKTPRLQNDFGQGWNGLSYSGNRLTSNENGSWGAAFNGLTRLWGQQFRNTQQIKPYIGLEDNIKDFYDLGHTFANSLRISAASDNSDFSIIFSKSDTDGIIPTNADAIKKRTLGLNTGVNKNKFTARVNANYAQTRHNIVNTGQANNAGEGNTLTQELLQIPRDISIVDLEDFENNIFNTTDFFYTPFSTNPYFLLNENRTTLNRERLFGNVNLSYKIDDKFTANWQWGTDIINTNRNSFGNIQNFAAVSPVADQGGTRTVGGVTEANNQTKHYETFATLDFKTPINKSIHLNTTFGVTYRDISSNNLEANITNLDVPNFFELTNSAEAPTINQNNTRSRNYSIFSTTTLSYKDRVYLNITGRNEWSSTFEIGNNSYFYPSVNLSVIALENNINQIKLRAGASKLANEAPIFRTRSVASQGVANGSLGQIRFPFNGVNAFEADNRLGNVNLEPEFTNEIELGVQAAFFNNRITTDIAIYNKITDGAIVDQNLPGSTGFTRITGNFIDIQNRGLELALGVIPIQNNHFSWHINYTFTKNKSKVLELPNGIDSFLINAIGPVSLSAVKGQPLGVFKAIVDARNTDGQLIVNPNTGIPVQTKEAEVIGTSERDFVMGLQNTFTYKNLSLNFGIDWKQGGSLYSGSANLLNFTGSAIATTYNNRNPFIFPNSVIENQDGTFSENTTPIDFESVTNLWDDSTLTSAAARSVIDKTFVRLRDLSFTYHLPKKVVQDIGVTNITFSLYGKNLILWTPKSNPFIDPEVTTFGNDIGSEFGEFNANPTQRTYGMAIKVSF